MFYSEYFGKPKIDNPVIDEDGTQKWYRDNQLHREDGPAVIHGDGGEVWFYNGALHRLDGPAITEPDGYQAWYKYDSRHCISGPAIIWGNTIREWFVNGVQCYDNESFQKAAGLDDSGMLLVILKHGDVGSPLEKR